MPHYIRQVEGPLVDAINTILDRHYAGGNIQETYTEFRELYLANEREGYHCEVAEFGEREHGHKSMIESWFPVYCNMPWSDGSESEGRAMVAKLEADNPGTRYALEWEY